MELFDWVVGVGGTSGALVVVLFAFLRYLTNQVRTDRRFMEDRMTGLLQEYNNVCRENKDATMQHVQILTELIVWLKARNGSR